MYSRLFYILKAIFEVFTAVKVQLEVFWVVKPCSVVVGYGGRRVFKR
jgi:hypothetical protein